MNFTPRSAIAKALHPDHKPTEAQKTEGTSCSRHGRPTGIRCSRHATPAGVHSSDLTPEFYGRRTLDSQDKYAYISLIGGIDGRQLWQKSTCTCRMI